MKIHHIAGYIQNIFLVEYKHGCLLLDGASRADFPHIVSYFKNTLKRPLSDLKVVLVTHMHPDHAGCAHKLKQASQCKIVTGQFDEQWYKGLKGSFSHIVDISLAYWVARRLNKPFTNLWYSTQLKPDIMLGDNEPIPWFEDWHVISTPGHTDRDISAVNNAHKKLYVADLIVRVKGEFTSPFPVHLPNEYRQSLKRLQAYLGYEVMMAHVPDTKLTAEMLEQLLSKAPSVPKTNIGAVKAKLKRIKLINSTT